MQPVELSYTFTKQHFNYLDKRDTGERYLDHLVRTLYNILEKTKNPTRLKCIVALFHDIIENTDNVTIETLLGLFTDEKLAKQVAISVSLLTKKSITDFISLEKTPEDYKKFRKIQEYSDTHLKKQGYAIVNKKGFLTREIEEKEKNGSISKRDIEILKSYRALKNKYSTDIESDYYPRFTSQESILKKAKEYSRKLWLTFSQRELKDVCETVLDVKDADRLDNLETEQDSSQNKIRKKVWEFEEYFEERIKVEKPEFYVYCKEAIEKLKSLIKNESNVQSTVEDTAWKIHKTTA